VAPVILRFDPFPDLDRLVDQLQRRPPGRPSIMPMDAYRDDDRMVVCLDLPGIDPGSLDVTVDGNVLTVTAQRYWRPAETQHVIAAERPTGRFQRQIQLSRGLDTDNVQARYDNGVLTVTIPIADAAKPRKVEISSPGHAKAIDAPAA
jgi:HSP20 family protein